MNKEAIERIIEDYDIDHFDEVENADGGFIIRFSAYDKGRSKKC